MNFHCVYCCSCFINSLYLTTNVYLFSSSFVCHVDAAESMFNNRDFEVKDLGFGLVHTAAQAKVICLG